MRAGRGGLCPLRLRRIHPGYLQPEDAPSRARWTGAPGAAIRLRER
ncbi:hypothetical protein Salmuc_05627 [Salipiger mucosus DSM 16094]|uniref:Uncharacterized protein n=1 Tax=Salipiger mucosus DSM 16094 TaxID=1123237 RepID=S9RNN6_9RHOB|nr:hypothetical protein Salmuc_05627 [Salipiger mucosus DSM 16094]